MKVKITKKNGDIVEIEGTADEVQKALDEEKRPPKSKKQVLLDDVRRIVAEELARQPRHCDHGYHYPWWTWTIQNPVQPLQPNVIQPQITFTVDNTKQPSLKDLGPLYQGTAYQGVLNGQCGTFTINAETAKRQFETSGYIQDVQPTDPVGMAQS